MENKEEPMKPGRYWFNKYLFKCRRCGKVLDILEHTYCSGCGQNIQQTNRKFIKSTF